MIKSLLSGMCIVANALLMMPAHAQKYPERPITLIVPFAAGSAATIVYRLVAETIKAELGQPVVLEILPGAAGLVGLEKGRRAPSDGYTLVGSSDAILIYPPLLLKSATFDPLTDFEPISMIASVDWVLVAHSSFPAKNLQEVIKAVKADPNTTYSSGGFGSGQHVGMEYFAQRAGIAMRQIPYKGITPALTAVAGNEVSLMLTSIATSLPFIKEGRLRAIAVPSAVRSTQLPDVPTFIEAGLPGFEFGSWISMSAPLKVSQDKIELIQRAIAKSMADPAIRAQLLTAGLTPVGSTPDEMRRRLTSDNRKLTDLVRSLGIKPE
jgi:tripartite-type tricarboxylate transporter receptor subunit TctC